MVTAIEAKEAATQVILSLQEDIIAELDAKIQEAASKGCFSIDITGLILIDSIRSILDASGYRIVAKKSDNYIIKQELFWD